jgi:hypothetical protein
MKVLKEFGKIVIAANELGLQTGNISLITKTFFVEVRSEEFGKWITVTAQRSRLRPLRGIKEALKRYAEEDAIA